MTQIDNDQALRAALKTLNAEQQRVLGARFAERVMPLCRDERVKRAIATGLREPLAPDEQADAFKSARAYAVTSYTDCGKETDWLAQADHFVAAAITAALTPDEATTDKQNRAWKAAVQVRMAVNCAMMEDETISESDEARQQYALAEDFLG